MADLRSSTTLLRAFGFAAAVSILASANGHAADILDCSAAITAASNPHSIGRLGVSGSGWSYRGRDPRLLDANGRQKRIGNSDELRGEIELGDRIEATMELMDERPSSRRSGPVPNQTYRFRWIAPRALDLGDGVKSRCTAEASGSLPAGMKNLHTFAVGEMHGDNISGEWKFITYDAKGNPLTLYSYELSNPKTKEEKAGEILSENFKHYMLLDKCLAMNLSPLSKEDYRQAVASIDKNGKTIGLDTKIIWQRAASDFKEVLNRWDQHVAGYTGLSWETRKTLRDACAATSSLLMRAAREASGDSMAPKKDF